LQYISRSEGDQKPQNLAQYPPLRRRLSSLSFQTNAVCTLQVLTFVFTLFGVSPRFSCKAAGNCHKWPSIEVFLSLRVRQYETFQNRKGEKKWKGKVIHFVRSVVEKTRR
jgi:hypothetical protein